MSGTKSVAELIEEFPPSEERRAILEWLLPVFELWDEGKNGKVTQNRDKVAKKVGEACELFPDQDLPTWPPNYVPGDDDFAKRLLHYAVNAFSDAEPGLRSTRCGYFVKETKYWLGLPQ